MRYKFEQFDAEIENPSLEVDMTRIVDNTIKQELTIPIVLATENSRFGIELNDIVYVNSWNDSDIETLVMNRLLDFEINT